MPEGTIMEWERSESLLTCPHDVDSRLQNLGRAVYSYQYGTFIYWSLQMC